MSRTALSTKLYEQNFENNENHQIDDIYFTNYFTDVVVITWSKVGIFVHVDKYFEHFFLISRHSALSNMNRFRKISEQLMVFL